MSADPSPVDSSPIDLYAFVTVDPETHREELLASRDMNFWQPLITTDPSQVSQLGVLKQMAKRRGAELGRTVKLIHFTGREELPV